MDTSRITPPSPETLGISPERPYFQQFHPENLPSPCFIVDRAAIQYNLDILAQVAKDSGATILAALKAFSFFEVFDQIRESLSGACASGIHEARLAREKINKEVHTFAPAYKDGELAELLQISDHIVFNNLHQWEKFQKTCLKAQKEQREMRSRTGRSQLEFGIRINPEHSEGTVPIYDPCAPFSRLGITRGQWNRELDEAGKRGITAEQLLTGISGIHFHTLCEQGSEPLARTYEAVKKNWSDVLALPGITWLNMGGGHHITKPDYNRALLIATIKQAIRDFQLKIYLEPGEAVAIHTGILLTTVVDIHQNKVPIGILDTSATCHMPDTLEMPYTPLVWGGREIKTVNRETDLPKHVYRLGGQTCLAGDVIGDYAFQTELNTGSTIIFDDMAHYTMVKTTTFNGIPLPGLGVHDSRTGQTRIIKTFGYEDFEQRLS